ncbi:glycosyltransferase [Mongoliitalea daihaiensis]|uniref:glycosyltransferase n=1 Tax=Mongoliitalea daihaiensis TaxID=2782006 RepID=UPI001F1FA391|nr:glycosyltransferase [Mongoliitalea daihaiensis]UJP64172.1 glycosyltransferase family 2 protein [Mongoliitalea daihaiensis]
MKGFSILICCYNSKERIKPTLEHLVNLKIPESYGFEVIIIDNNSNDGTSLFVKDCAKKIGLENRLRIVIEDKPGLSYARICGIKNAVFNYLVFCDDDNWLFENYLEKVAENFENNQCVIVGGLGFPVSSIEFPKWFIDVDGWGYAVGSEGRSKGPNQMIHGAGMALKKNFALKYATLKGSFLLSDRKGKSLTSGGDAELCLIAGLDSVFYDNEMKFHHFLPHNRLTKEYYLKLNYGFGFSSSTLIFYKLYKYESNWLAFKIYVSSIVRDFRTIIFLKNRNFENSIKKQFLKGSILGKFLNLLIFFKLRKMVIKNLNV